MSDPFEQVEKGSAEGYLALCKQVAMMAVSAKDLREWWRLGVAKRRFYELTDDQEAELTAVCKAQIAKLEAAEPPKPKPKPRWQPRRARI